MMYNRLIFLVTVCSMCLAFDPARSRATDFGKESIPGKWIEPLLPEKLEALDLREYQKTDPITKARTEAFAGRYRLALSTLRLSEKELDPTESALIAGASQAAIGELEAAIKTLSNPAIADEPRVQIARARVFVIAGRLDDAISLLKAHLAAHPESIAGHYELGDVSERVGDTVAAKAAYSWFLDPPQRFFEKWESQKETGFDNAEEVTLIARAVDRWATLNSAYEKNVRLHDEILNMFVRAYDVIDRAYWPAHVAAAEYLMSHDDQKGAIEELTIANEANPNDVSALRLFGILALDQYNFDGVDAVIDAMREVDPKSVDADLLETRNLLLQRRPKDAEIPVRRVLDQQPHHIEAMGLLAGAYSLQLRDDECAALIKQVEALDPDNASAYFEVAEQLSSLRQYPRSAAMYQVAIDRAPWWTTARNGLGLLYTQSGDEDLARSVLDAAHALDPFNVRTTNYLRLLDDLAKFATKESDHFIVYYDATMDPMIPEYFSDYLESIHAQVCKVFNHEPSVKTFIEVFPTHDAFSVRTTGAPWIGTVGASTGRVIALVSPRGGGNTLGTFNWSAVLRHEYTHTVTLSATENRIPHWMTEGLAVYEEHSPLRWEWVPMLYSAVKTKNLFTMENLTWGFVRPKRPIDRQLAYAQSFWICKYIEQTYGHDAILKMLEEYRKGGRQEDVFPKVINRTLDQFSEEFFAWTEKEISTWGYDPETTKKYDALRDEGESLIKARQYEDAIKIWEEIAKIRPMDALPHQRLAGLYLNKAINLPDKAIEHLSALHAVELKDNRYAKRIARIYRTENQSEKAVNFARDAVYIDPYDLDAHELFHDVLEKIGDSAGVTREDRAIAELKSWKLRMEEASKLPDPE